ncbi:MAG: phosphoglycerate dehydrogenase [Myxococcales bacterium]|nr:phosphoglycerate dehydrogenase [Myxococcales bacterium]
MPLFKVLIADEMSPRAVEILKAHPEIEVVVQTGLKGDDLQRALVGVHGLAVRSATKVTAQILEAAQSLRVVGRAGIGVDNIDVKAASRRGVVVMNTPSGNAITTAEHALCLLLSLARHIPQATASMKAGQWEKKKFEGTELCGKTLGVLGLGNIGRIVADRALGLKMKVIAFDPVLTAEAAAKLGVELVSVDEVFRRADFITVHTPLIAETRGLIGAEAFRKMKDGVLIVNAARGGIVDEVALAEAIKSGKVGGAALDVFVQEPPPKEHPLLALDRVIATPHLGASTEEAQEKVALEVAEQIAAFLLHGEVKNSVNLPPLPGELRERVQPFLDLAGRLGELASQLTALDGGGIEAVEIEIAGEVADKGSKAIAAAAVAGLLRRHLDVPVNEVNALLLAGERGIQVSQISRPQAADFTSSVSVRLTGKGRERFAFFRGTVFHTGEGLEPRLVQIDRFLLEAVPDGRVLILVNQDRPGVIGAVGTLLGGRGINVSRMQVGLDRTAGEALQIWNVDGAIDPATLDAVRKLANVRSASVVEL